jgi:hypothetical protein
MHLRSDVLQQISARCLLGHGHPPEHYQCSNPAHSLDYDQCKINSKHLRLRKLITGFEQLSPSIFFNILLHTALPRLVVS